MNRAPLSIALIAVLIINAVPAQAMDAADINERIREQQAARCHELGGTYDYPRCYIPDQKEQESRPNESECNLGCQLIMGTIALAAARIAYCTANPGKC